MKAATTSRLGFELPDHFQSSCHSQILTWDQYHLFVLGESVLAQKWRSSLVSHCNIPCPVCSNPLRRGVKGQMLLIRWPNHFNLKHKLYFFVIETFDQIKESESWITEACLVSADSLEYRTYLHIIPSFPACPCAYPIVSQMSLLYIPHPPPQQRIPSTARLRLSKKNVPHISPLNFAHLTLKLCPLVFDVFILGLYVPIVYPLL